MKIILLTLISFYQYVLSPIFSSFLGQRSFCRYSPSCSAYAKQVITRYGALQGSVLTLRRILSCRPKLYEYI